MKPHIRRVAGHWRATFIQYPDTASLTALRKYLYSLNEHDAPSRAPRFRTYFGDWIVT